jgi:hypothetical protein
MARRGDQTAAAEFEDKEKQHMEPGHYTDPLEEALSHGSQRVAQFASLTGAMAQVVLQRRALHDARNAARNDQRATRILGEQERLIHQQARLRWAPAHDPHWLAKADLLQAGSAWAGAASHADTDPAAASAMRKCENRLRTLHPYAMARYDRLRGDGMSPLDAMRDTVPLFSRHPDARVGDPAPARSALAASTGQDASQPAEHSPGGAAEPEPGSDGDERAARGRQIIERLQSGARAAGRPEVGPDELAMVLEAATNLPEDMIGRLTRQAAAEGRARNEEHRAAAAERARAADLGTAIDLAATPAADERTIGLAAAQRDTGVADIAQARAGADRSAAQLAAQSFPHSAADVVQAAATAGTRRTALSPARMPTPDISKRPGPPM